MSASQKIIFLHIPKTAGTSFRHVIEQNYPAEKCCWIYDVEWGTGISQFEKLSQEKKESFDVVGGHLRFGFHRHFSSDAKYITFLRDPVARVISYYYFLLNTPDNAFHEEAKQFKTLESFVRGFKGGNFNNGQTKRIAGPWDGKRKIRQRLYEHIENHFAAIGLVEHFETSLQHFAHKLGWKNIAYQKANINPAKKPLREISPATRRLIRNANWLDMELYDFAKKQILKI